ncbi:MAG: hypothetical protein FJ149_02805 [Euryarchaeota archaeon]|nr:hypothetical protein [Euryarchaeota archaeon]
MRCPNCGREYGGSLLRLDWCPGDRAYFCKSCTRERAGCPACRSRPAGLHLGAAILVLFTVMLVSAAAVLPQHISRSIDIGTDPVNFDNATAGREVKLQSTLRSPGKIAFILLLRDDRWQLQMKANASIVDGSGKSIRLDLSDCHDFHPIFHNRSNTTKSEYWNGDNVTVFGRVRDDGTGNRTLEVRRIYPGGKDPYLLEPGWYQTLWLVPAVSLILFLQVSLFYLYRRRLHAAYVRAHPVADPSVLEPPGKETPVIWKSSPLLLVFGKRSRNLFILSALLLAIMLAGSLLAPWAWNEYPLPMAASTLGLLFSVMAAYYFWEAAHITPVETGFSKAGIHFRYSPRRASEQIVSLGWPDILMATSSPEFSTARMRFVTRKRVEEVILPKGLLGEMEEQHLRNVYPGL